MPAKENNLFDHDLVISLKEGVGPIRLGMPISEVASLPGFIEEEPIVVEGHPVHFVTNSQIGVNAVAVETPIVDGIDCYKEAYLFGSNLIGMPFQDVCNLVGMKPERWGEHDIDDDSTQDIAYFDLYGLALCIESGKVTSVEISDGVLDD